MAASLSVAAVVFPVSSRHQGSCLLIAAHHDISNISQDLVPDTSASAVNLRHGTVQWCVDTGPLGHQGALGT